jgi:putative membrane-bound dehydrogenase-like protein
MKNRILALAVVIVAMSLGPAAENHGIRPVDASGRPLNLDFETGDLRDWKVEGEAFRGQPIRGDTVTKRRADMKSEHQGEFWIGGYEKFGDQPQGTLTSVPFKVTHPWASFLVGGGPHAETSVELRLKGNDELIVRVAGIEEENLKRVAVDLRSHVGKEIYIRLVDRHSGHWGHVNFDDFRFHTEQPNFPVRKAPEPLPGPDQYKFAGLPPDKAAEAMTVPEGFRVSLFAGEPDVHQPIAMCLDHRGRLWVAEAYVYPRRLPFEGARLPDDQKHRGDRILIFEDTNNDGRFDKRTVFLDGLNLVSGLEVGFGGVWVGAAPYLLFIPDRDGDDKPDGPPQVLLDGWHFEDTHETLNAFIWGPEGWLYGCHGVFTHSRVGKPGTPEQDRQPINAGIWRYHPTKHIFEVFAHGTSNPWGLDFNDHGEAFIEACVIPHCFHIVQGGRYHRQAGQHFNPHTYFDIPTIADHRHYVGNNPHGGNNRSDSAGGGHAHCGLMCYLGGSWPPQYRNKLFMGNIHGRRLNVDLLRPNKSGYTASHQPDFLLANDSWARFINMRYGPDGDVYVLDWYDKQACHRTEPEIWDRSNGRIYKIIWRERREMPEIDIENASDNELVLYQLHSNDWYVRHARRALQERYHDPAARQRHAQSYRRVCIELRRIAKNHPLDFRRLRAIWALNVIGAFDREVLNLALEDESPHVRGWGIRLAEENGLLHGELLRQAEQIAAQDVSPVVRRYLASAAQRLALEARQGILKNLLAHTEDADDPNLPYLIWYALEPLADARDDAGLRLAAEASWPIMLEFMVRRIASAQTPEAVEKVVALLAHTADTQKQRSVLTGLSAGLKGRRQLPMPKSWPDAVARLRSNPRPDPDLTTLTQSLAVTFGDPNALRELRQVLTTAKHPRAERLAALETLVSANDAALPPILRELLIENSIRSEVIRAMAAFDDPANFDRLVEVYPSLGMPEKRQALATLSSRRTAAIRLLRAIADRKIPATDVPADLIRQLTNLRDPEIDKQIAAHWGVVRRTPGDRTQQMAHYRQMILKPGPAPDALLGRAIYAKTCQQCHTLFGVGGKVGPDITGANRQDLNYLLENIIDPSAVIPKEYMASRIDLKNGRTITGIIKETTPQTLTIVTATETLVIGRDDVEEMAESQTSMMPDDQLKSFSEHEVRSLFAYLSSPRQVPMLATPENAKDLFNGKDLAGWDGDPKLWTVENGEIVGRSPGLKRNEFLKSQIAAADFVLTLKVKLQPNQENSGIQFRSEVLPDGDVRGLQADIGAGWWGKLYEEHLRGLLWDKPGDSYVRINDWNEYKIEAVGDRVRTWINGQLCVDLTDDKIARRGIFALQLHSGGPFEIRFKDIRLEVK